MTESKKYVAEFEIKADGAVVAINNLSDAQGKAEESSKNLKQQLRELQRELLQGAEKLGAERFAELSQKVGQLKDEIKDTAEVVNAQAGSAFENLSNSAGLLGESLLNLDLEGATKAMNVLATNVSKVNFKSLTSGSNEFGKAFFNLGKSLLLNPIFLIGTIVALIIVNFDKLINIIPGLSKAFEVVGNVIGFVVDKAKQLLDAIGLTEFAAADALDKSIANRDEKIAELDRQEKRAKANAKKNGEDTQKIEEEFTKKRIALYQKIIADAQKLRSEGSTLTKEQVDALKDAQNQLFEIETTQIQKEAEIADKARQDAEKAQAEADKIAEQKAKERAEKAKRAAEERKAKEAEVTNFLKAAEEERFQATLSAQDRELRQNELKYQKLLNDAKNNQALQAQVKEEEERAKQGITDKYAKINDDKEKQRLFEANQKRLETQDAQFALEQELELKQIEQRDGLLAAQREKEIQDLVAAYDAKFVLANGNAEKELLLQEQLGADVAAIRQKYAKTQEELDAETKRKQIEGEQALRDAKVDAAKAGLQGVADLVTSFAGKSEKAQKRAFEINKGIQIAMAIMDTYKAATGILASASANPSTVLFPAQPFIMAGAAIAAGLANVNNIRKQQFQGGSSPSASSAPSPPMGGGGGGGMAGINASAPAFSGLNLSFLQNRPQQPNPAYVLAGDVSNGLEARKKVEDLARLNAR